MAQSHAQWQLQQDTLTLTGRWIETQCRHCGPLPSSGNRRKKNWNAH